ncbi:MAG TPA: sigma-70 family RNA polymerase sigma factor [Bryobacteraceae bacterium]|jgi:RNA polymerase sigma factor (sigma-70 family)|nr:sigma-70 family RNA polymerase sigma factor [Bryobacteraceae bacterium]
MAIVRRIAKEQSRVFVHVQIEDLEQQGYVGLLEAARRYDPAAGSFGAFAYFRIRGAIVDAHKRRRWREEMLESLQAIAAAHDGWLPPSIATCPLPRPDELAARGQMAAKLANALGALASEDAELLRAWAEGAPIREQCEISGMSPNYTRDRVAQLIGRVRALIERTL